MISIIILLKLSVYRTLHYYITLFTKIHYKHYITKGYCKITITFNNAMFDII